MIRKPNVFIVSLTIYKSRSYRIRQQIITQSSLSFQIGSTINWLKVIGGIGNILEKVIHQRLDRTPSPSLPVIETPNIVSHRIEDRNIENNGINVFAIIALTLFTSIAIVKGVNFLYNSHSAEKSMSLHHLNDLEISNDFEKAQENVRILCTEKTGFISVVANFLVCNFEIITIIFIVISLSTIATLIYLAFLKQKRDKMDNGNIIDVNDSPDSNSFIGK